MSINEEKFRRLQLAKEIGVFSSPDVSPSELRRLKIYSGAAGIWRDRDTLGHLSKSGEGLAISILHTGRHYPDDLSDDGLIYHYPKTNRSEKHDKGEILATKEASLSGLPIFIILPGKTSIKKRCVKLGWVADWDDENAEFLILFGDEKPGLTKTADADTPFNLTDNGKRKKHQSFSRPNQQQFRFNVLKRSGGKCAVCEIQVIPLLVAAHVRDKGKYGSDDPRNGIILCQNHHKAFDSFLFGIEPVSNKIIASKSTDLAALGISVEHLTPIKHPPHQKALEWKWGKFQTSQKE